MKLPTPEQLREISASYDRIDQLVGPALAEPSVTYPRLGVRRPEPKILNAARAFEAAGSYDVARPEGVKSAG